MPGDLREQLVQKKYNIPVWLWILSFVVLSFMLYYIFSEKSSTCTQNFTIDEDSEIKVYNFNTSWCGWSRKFQPEWDKFDEKVKNDNKLSSRVRVYDVKCDNEDNNSICSKNDIPGYPFVLVVKNGVKTPYKGERTSSALLSHVSRL
jgi:hypothetical protein